MLSGVALATTGMFSGLCLPSSAAQLWNWSSNLGSGTFTTDDGPSPYTITGITGTINIGPGHTITSLFPPGFLGSDNLLYTSSPQLSGGGVAFDTTGPIFRMYWGAFPYFTDYNLSLEERDWYRMSNFSASIQTPSTTPEPSSFLSFIALGGLIFGGAVRRARK
jgi:hypothetical protein